jgi:cytochrome b
MKDGDFQSDDSPVALQVRVWDLSTRLFHWTVVLLVAFSWYTADNGLMKLHLWSGLLLLTLLVFRIAWGIVGSTTARFTDFVAGPGAVVGYIVMLAKGHKPVHAGHNPAGGWMVLVLMAVLLLQVSLGLFANDDMRFNGPLSMLISSELSDRLTELHTILFNIILLLVWVHLVAVGFYLFVKDENLVTAMISGKKRQAHVPPDAKLRFIQPWIALLLLALSAGVVALILI